MDRNLVSFDKSILLKIYDTIRYVKPIEKQCSTNNDIFEDELLVSSPCFSVWGKSSACENCISIRAIKEKKVFMKLEYSAQKIYMVTSVPLNEYPSDHRVMELVKDVTNDNILDSKDLSNDKVLAEKINAMNRELISDPLTHLFNRRFMDERLPYELAKSIALKMPLGLIMADIDFFKIINDTYGHQAGDQILIEFSNLLKNSIREDQDWVIRYGGEEFLLFISDSDSAKLIEKSEEIRISIENHIFKLLDTDLKITASFGLYSAIPIETEHDITIETFIDRADKALYHSKNTGRNKVSSFTEMIL